MRPAWCANTGINERRSALSEHVDAVNPPGLLRFDTLARDVADAYTSADVEKLREINWTYGTSFRWERQPELMHAHLPTWFAASARTADQAIADARQLVAAMSGFQDWNALVDNLSAALKARPTGGSAGMEASPARLPEAHFYSIDLDRRTIGVRGPLSERHWDTVVSVMREHGLTGVWAPGAPDAALQRLSHVEGITRLHVGGGQLSDEGLRHVARLGTLEELSLGGPRSAITDRGLDVLRHLPCLTRAWMPWTPRITDAGVANLAQCERLEIVDLMGTPTGDAAIAALAGHSSLRRFASGTRVTDAGTARLAGFPQFRTWHNGEIACDLGRFDSDPTHLLIDGPFTGAGLACFPDLDGLFGLNLFWHATHLTSASFEAIAALPRLGFLRIDRDGATTDDNLAALSRSRTLQQLSCGDHSSVTGRGFAALATMPLLQGLSIDCGSIEDQSLVLLAQFPSLRTFWPRNLSDERFQYVGACSDLASLAFPQGATDAATRHIATLPHLRTLSAANSAITDRSLEILAHIPSLQALDLHDCPGITDAGIASLSALPQLTTLVVYGCPHVTPMGTATLPSTVQVKRSCD